MSKPQKTIVELQNRISVLEAERLMLAKMTGTTCNHFKDITINEVLQLSERILADAGLSPDGKPTEGR